MIECPVENGAPASDFSSAQPDGQHIAFVSTRDRAWEIYLMNADGSSISRLTRGTAINQSPMWSPDGKRIYFESNGEILSMNLDGSSVVNVTNNPATDFHPSCTASARH
mgnify:CR=1 FL=1